MPTWLVGASAKNARSGMLVGVLAGCVPVAPGDVVPGERPGVVGGTDGDGEPPVALGDGDVDGVGVPAGAGTDAGGGVTTWAPITTPTTTSPTARVPPAARKRARRSA
ncbi:hypothetical protein ACFYP0_20875 [Micromonospora arida]|uniref:hypothetical protein n=1 Tax=Micromonospora arida TaxID=2203715 RepID=UPI0033F8D50A